MAEHDGSRWYHPVYEGLWEAKHCRQMGPAVWLYGWMLSRAFVARNGGGFVYSHADAARELGVSDKTARLWFERLQQYGYTHIRARHAYHLEVEVTNWRPVEEWLEAKAETERTVNNYRSVGENGKEIGKENGNKNGKELPLSPISIRLLGYEYPPATQEGATSAPPSLVGAFRWLWELLRDQKNKSATSAEIYRLTFGEEPPEYGFLGRTAKAVGGWGRMIELFWQVATKRPSGDALEYVMKMGKGQIQAERRNGQGETARVGRELSKEQKRLNQVAFARLGEGEDGRDV